MMAELFARGEGICHGKGGSMHVADPSRGVLGANAIVGASLPLAVGAGMSSKLLGQGRVAVAFFGEGAVNQGAFHEAVNLAAIWDLPTVLVCENNVYAEFSDSRTLTRVPSVAERAAAYGIEADGRRRQRRRRGLRADASDAAARCREGRGPVPDRGRDLPLARPLRGRRPALQARGARRPPGASATRSRSPRRGCGSAARPSEEELERIRAEAASGSRARSSGRARCPPPSPRRPTRMSSATEPQMAETRYIDALNEGMATAIEEDERVVLIGIDVGAGGGIFRVTNGLFDRFGPERVLDTPISEMGYVGAAVGAAMTGLRPIVEIMFMDFVGVCMDPILNQAAKLRYMTAGALEIPVVFRMQTGAGKAAGAQHSQSLEAWFAHVPGLKVVMPATVADARDLLLASVRDPNPVVFVENRRLYASKGDVDADPLPLGKARVARAGERRHRRSPGDRCCAAASPPPRRGRPRWR